MSFAATYLDAETQIVALLQAAKIANVRTILTAGDLATVQENQQITPALHVIYNGESVPSASDMRGTYGSPQVVYQQWLVVIAVRNVKKIREGEGAREDAGPIMNAVIKALQGVQLSADFPRHLRRATPPKPKYTTGFAYFPLAFTLEVDT
ncbi:phage tail terminator protein [Acidihalobacter prosperus]|uniref:Phage protein n=1 Tax=Acidihalobacter prosperus TaxID=160660 RepID=A0A1A6C895_9GAMM|nr:hypothetical protein [Acidihalobacter prosperus]OBS10788.1 hypothetical protein Thpro_020504 [Acidihalobacter prosperus]